MSDSIEALQVTENMYRFCVDGRPHESRRQLLNAMEIKGIAGVPYDHILLCRLKRLGDEEPIEVDGQEFHSTPQAYW